MKQALTLTDQQYKQVVAFCSTRKHTLRDQTIVHISFLAGLRAIEIAGLRVGDVYDDTGSVRAQFSISGKQTKGGDTRTIYVSRKLRRVLEQYHAVIAGCSSSDPLCGLKGVSSHSGRRTFITKLANTGINVRLLAALAGHSDISTTQRYIDVNDTQLANAVELI